MLAMLIAYDASNNVIGTLDHLVAVDADGSVKGLVDFDAIERAGTPLTDVWTVASAVGSGTWPEWIGHHAHDFTVELEPGWSMTDSDRKPHRIRALVHKASGLRRERSAVDEAILARITAAGADPADIRDIVGGPTRPLQLDESGRVVQPSPTDPAPSLPLIPVAGGTGRRG